MQQSGNLAPQEFIERVHLRQALMRRRAIAEKALAGIACRMTPGALHVWIPLPEGLTEAAMVERAKGRGVAVAAGSSFHVGRAAAPQAIRVALAASSELELASSLSLVAAILKGERQLPKPVMV